MKDIKVSVGVWFMGATSDRFVKAGYRPDSFQGKFQNQNKNA